jgi:hypothetical protein
LTLKKLFLSNFFKVSYILLLQPDIYHSIHLIIFYLWHSKILGFLLISMLHFYTCFYWFFQMTETVLTIRCKICDFCRISIYHLVTPSICLTLKLISFQLFSKSHIFYSFNQIFTIPSIFQYVQIWCSNNTCFYCIIYTVLYFYCFFLPNDNKDLLLWFCFLLTSDHKRSIF